MPAFHDLPQSFRREQKELEIAGLHNATKWQLNRRA